MRAPFQILAIPYKKEPEIRFCVFQRSDTRQYQFIAGGGENNETAYDAAIREIKEETDIDVINLIKLTSIAYIPANVISEKYRNLWNKNTYVIPEYAFAFECNKNIHISREHINFEWLTYNEALSKLTWDSNKTALYELNCRLFSGLTIQI